MIGRANRLFSRSNPGRYGATTLGREDHLSVSNDFFLLLALINYFRIDIMYHLLVTCASTTQFIISSESTADELLEQQLRGSVGVE